MKFAVFPEGSPHLKKEVEAVVNANLLDTLNDQNLQDLSVFGICDKQLACHSCRVNFVTHFDKLPKPTEDELDVLDELGKLNRFKSTRMACQIKIDPNMEGCMIEIPRSAFAFFEKFKDE